jgi:uncharacterized membrane protein YebE (DUF533 family)
MNFQNLLSQFTGSSNSSSSTQQNAKSSGLGSGLMGGAAAGGVMALLVGSKKGRKFAGKAATVGGAALIGGIAFKAYKNWQQNNQPSSDVNSGQISEPILRQIPAHQSQFSGNEISMPEISQEFQLTLIKAMIGAAKSDGHVDEIEQKRIFDALDQMSLSTEIKGVVFDLLRQPIYVEELAHNAQNMEQRSEVYLVSCLAIDLDNSCEHNYLNKLATALGLPLDLAEQLKSQAKEALDSERVLN